MTIKDVLKNLNEKEKYGWDQKYSSPSDELSDILMKDFSRPFNKNGIIVDGAYPLNRDEKIICWDIYVEGDKDYEFSKEQIKVLKDFSREAKAPYPKFSFERDRRESRWVATVEINSKQN